ncbi:MAG: hypothetical protein JWM68_2593, partial [Verrucomicrobiales bacterium]|nr:hypothetical protein [Verrucomicrobiales bacterium]
MHTNLFFRNDLSLNATAALFFGRTVGILSGLLCLFNSTALALTLTVNNGTGSGTYTSGTIVNIAANPPATGFIFDKWTGASIGLPLITNTTLTMPPVNTVVTATYKSAIEPTWELWANGANGLPGGIFSTLAITTNHEIYYTFWTGPQAGYGRVCKANGTDPHSFSLLSPNGFIIDTTVQNNVSGLVLNARGEPIAAVGSTIGSTTSNVNWLYHYTDTAIGGGPGWVPSVQIQSGNNYFYTTRMIDSDPLSGVCWVVGESPAIWRSLDGGDTFTPMAQQTKLPSNLRGGGPPMSREFAVSIMPPSARHPQGVILTAGENNGVVCSYDQATNWTSVDPNYLNPVSPLARVHPSYDGSVPNQVLTGGGDIGGLGWRPDRRIIVQSPSAFGYGGSGVNGTGGSDAVHLYSFLLDRPDLPALVASGIPNSAFAGGQGVQSQSIRTTTSGWTFVETPYRPGGGQGGIYMSTDGIHWTNVAAGINYPINPKSSGGIASGGKSSIAVDGNDVFMGTVGLVYHYVPPGTNCLSGVVRDAADQPVTNAIVRTAYGNWAVTSTNGSYAITNIGDSLYPMTISVSAAGLAFASQTAMVNGNNSLDFNGEASVLTSIAVTSPFMTVSAGGTMSFTATAKDQFDHPLPTQPPITWTTSDETSISNGFYTTLPGQETYVAIFASSGDITGFGYANGVVVPIPFITSLSTNKGPVYGGTSVTITGGNFPVDAAVLFGGVPVYGPTITGTSITCVTPDVSRSPTYGTGGIVPVSVVNNSIGSGTLPNGFNCVVTSPQTFLATITSGSSSGQTQTSRAPGSTLSLVAAAPPTGQVFYAWSGGGAGTFGNVTSSNTTFSMPTHDVSIVATYKLVPTLPQTSAPVISPAGGLESIGQLITITSATTNADIYYTLDGTNPTTPSTTPNPHGTLYTTPFLISGPVTLKAVAAAANRPDSGVAIA